MVACSFRALVVLYRILAINIVFISNNGLEIYHWCFIYVVSDLFYLEIRKFNLGDSISQLGDNNSLLDDDRSMSQDYVILISINQIYFYVLITRYVSRN